MSFLDICPLPTLSFLCETLASGQPYERRVPLPEVPELLTSGIRFALR